MPPTPPSPRKALVNIKPEELVLAVLMFGYFFLVITTFWILKPLKKDAFIGFYEGGEAFELFGTAFNGPEAELFAKVGNMLLAFLAVIVFTRLARTLRREQLTLVFVGFCAVATLGFLASSVRGNEFEVWLFYFYGDLFNTLMVATFFAFLNDSFTPEAAKRNYGLVVLGGVAGGAFGSMVVREWIDDFSLDLWLWICLGVTFAIGALAIAAGAWVRKHPPPERPQKVTPDEKQANAAVEGARLVFRSRYLLAIVTIVALYEIVSTILDFQFTSTIAYLLPREEQGEQFATVYAITNFFALGFQLFLTTLIMTRLGVRVALLIMPIAIIGMSGAYLVIPILWVGSLLNTADNGLNYSINQSARESLYTPTSRDEKYKAKAFIDMFVQRFAKALAVGVALLMTQIFDSYQGVRYLSVIVVALVAVWIMAALYAGRRFEQLEREADPEAE